MGGIRDCRALTSRALKASWGDSWAKSQTVRDGSREDCVQREVQRIQRPIFSALMEQGGVQWGKSFRKGSSGRYLKQEKEAGWLTFKDSQWKKQVVCKAH